MLYFMSPTKLSHLTCGKGPALRKPHICGEGVGGAQSQEASEIRLETDIFEYVFDDVHIFSYQIEDLQAFYVHL